MRIPVYIETNASSYIGHVEIDSPDQFEDAAEALWGKNGYNAPSLCRHCATFDLGDWEIGDSHLAYYFKEEEYNKQIQPTGKTRRLIKNVICEE